MDADTCFADDYFTSSKNKIDQFIESYLSLLRRISRTAKNNDVCSLNSIRSVININHFLILYRNANNVPVFVRVTDMFWSIGVMSNLYKNSPIKIPCSAYSLSMDLAVSVGFWDSGPEAIGEDMHMYLKCLFATKGHVIVKSIYSPASQCNIEGEGIGYRGWFSGNINIHFNSKHQE